MIKKNLYTGLVLIILGVLFLLYNLKMFDLGWILFFLSSALLARYFFRKDNIMYLISGLGLFAFSTLSLLDRYVFIGINIAMFVYLFVGGCGLIYLYYKGRERNWLIAGSVLIALAINNIVGQVWVDFIPWGKYFLIALGFYLSYLIAYRINEIVWPKYIAYVLLVLGGMQIFINKDTLIFADFRLSYLMPIIVILIGVRIIYLAIGKR